jgi:hypothetical protein
LRSRARRAKADVGRFLSRLRKAFGAFGAAQGGIVQRRFELLACRLAFRRSQGVGGLRTRAACAARCQQESKESAHHRGLSSAAQAGSRGAVRQAPHDGSLTLKRTGSETSMPTRRATSLTRAKRGEQPTSSIPARSDIGENTASELIESPRKPGSNPLDAHDFADGGGSGGAEAFSRARKQRKKPR